MAVPRRILALLARALGSGPLSFTGLTLVAAGGYMAWAPLGVILMGMVLIITAVARNDVG